MNQLLNREFNAPQLPSIVFGPGSIGRLGEKVEELGGRRALVVTGQSLMTETNLVQRIEEILGDSCASVFSGVMQHTPRECVFEGARVAKKVDADILVSVGGGSAIDAAKGINIVLTEGIQLDDFMIRLDGANITIPQLKNPKLPQIAIPTTLSGAEFSNLAGITNTKRKYKDAFCDIGLVPKVVILDPEMTVFTPPKLWASGGMKCLADCFEQFCSPRHHPFIDALALHAIQIIKSHLVHSITEPLDLQTRGVLQHVPLMSQYGGRIVGVGMIAALRHQIGPMYNIAHGVASGIVFVHCINFYRPLVDACLILIAEALSLPAGDASSSATAVLNTIRELIRETGLPSRLRDVGIQREELKLIAETAMRDYMIWNSPKAVNSVEQVLSVLEEAW